MSTYCGPIGEPRREVIVTPEVEPVPMPLIVPDSPADLPAPKREDVPA